MIPFSLSNIEEYKAVIAINKSLKHPFLFPNKLEFYPKNFI
jgi:hypothetical protein